MKVTKVFIKRRYMNFRQGATTLTPIMSFSNFLMLAYLTISEVIPFTIFVPIFIVFVLISFTLVGSKFRKIQQSTDINMSYEKSTEALYSFYVLMKRVDDISKELKMKSDPVFEKRMKYVKQIGESYLK